MKVDMTTTKNGAIIPPAALKASDFGAHEGAECHAINDCVVVLKKNMNTMELIRAAWSLISLASDLTQALTDQCGYCDGKCGSCNHECPYGQTDFSVDIHIPEEIREIADMSDDAVLHVEFPEDGGVLICESVGDPPELWDVPQPIMEGLLLSGACPATLETLIKSGEAVYGNKEAAR